MPLIVISGYPCAGKTQRAQQLASHFEARVAAAAGTAAGADGPRSVVLINDQTLGVERAAYAAAGPEKEARAAHASAIKRALGRRVLVIADGLHYIKGFRYQLYCEAKAARTPSCVNEPREGHERMSSSSNHGQANICRGDKKVTAETEVEDGAELSGGGGSSSSEKVDSGYEAELFENLIYRYEEPDGRSRWDSPLFTVLPDDADPPYDAIWRALVGAGNSSASGSGGLSNAGGLKPVKPNQSTVLAPATAPDALYALDRTTAAIAAAITTHLAEHADEIAGGGGAGGEVRAPGVAAADGAVVRLPAGGRPLTVAQVQRLRREFVGLWRGHGTAIATDRVGAGFVRFLNARWSGDGEDDGGDGGPLA